MNVRRIDPHPLIEPSLDENIGTNINGPSLIRVPDWVRNPLGRYYLYFGHHQGKFIRMAYSDTITGPYKVYRPGVLALENTPFMHHIASPDGHVDQENQRIWMHYHGAGCTHPHTLPFNQTTCFATSEDGLNFHSARTYVAESYLRSFEWNGWRYAFSGGSLRILSRSHAPDQLFERGPVLQIEGECFSEFVSEHHPAQDEPVRRMRHVGMLRQGDLLHLFYSNVGDCPERIKRSIVRLTDDWSEWKGAQFEEVMRPETNVEGANLPLIPSCEGASREPVHELRDPYLFEENGVTYLFYSTAGENGIAVATLELSD